MEEERLISPELEDIQEERVENLTFPLYRPSFLFYLVCTPCTPMFEKMIDDGDICAAEDLLFNDLDQSDLSWLQIALDFYSKLNNCSDDYLAMHDFSREEIDQGLRYICTLFGYDFLVSN